MPKTVWTISKKKSEHLTDTIKLQFEEKKALASYTMKDTMSRVRFRAKVKAAEFKAGASLRANDIRKRFR